LDVKKRKQVGGSHYKDLTLEPWEVAEAWCSVEERRGHFKISLLQYISRWDKKGGVLDLEKGLHHLEEWIRMEKKYAAQNNARHTRGNGGKRKNTS
jgi:hypothetical protein